MFLSPCLLAEVFVHPLSILLAVRVNFLFAAVFWDLFHDHLFQDHPRVGKVASNTSLFLEVGLALDS